VIARSAKIRSKGQITIPIEVLRDMDWKEGDQVEFEKKDGIVELRPARGYAERTAGIGAKYRLPKPLTLEEEKDAVGWAIAEEVVEQMRNE
jgi:AbrB family looped-hinge helix DNA binding protein